MRLFVFNCLLLASVAEAAPNEHHQRDLPYLKNLITSAIFGRSQINIQPQPILQEENGYKLFRLPGYEDIMIKVAPKKPVVEEFVYPPAEQVNLNAFRTVVGTQSKDALVAVKEVDDVLSRGILYGGHNNVMKETIVPMFPSLDIPYYVEEKIKTVPVIKTRPVLTEVIETGPVVTEVRPVEEKVELKLPFEPIYSYKQIQHNEPVMTYNNRAVEVLETIKMKTELPMCIKKRVDEAIMLGADPNRFAPVQKVYQYQSPTVVDYSYPRVDTNSYVQNPFRGEVFAEGFETGFGLSPQRLSPLKDSPVRYNLRPTKTQAINPRPIPLRHSHKSLHLEEDISAIKDKVNSQTRKIQAFNNLGKKLNLSQTLGSFPRQYITHVINKGGNSAVSNEKIMKQMKAVPIVGSKDNVSNAKIPISVYKQQPNPNTGKVVKDSNALKTNVKGTSIHYVSAPAANRDAPKKNNVNVKNVVFTNKVTEKPQSVTSPVVVASTNVPKRNLLRENIQTSIINKPIVIKDAKNYSYQQKNADGPSVNVNGSKNGDSVNIKEHNATDRGDIPDK